MRKFLIAALLAAGPAMSSELVFRAGADEIRIFDTACVHAGTLARIKPEARSRFRKASATVQGSYYYGCWTQEGDQVFILYEDGDQGVVPTKDFKEPKTA